MLARLLAYLLKLYAAHIAATQKISATKKPARLCLGGLVCIAATLLLLAEAVRFELTNPCGLPVFKTGAIDHSAKLPVYTSVFVIILDRWKVEHCNGKLAQFPNAAYFATSHKPVSELVSWYIRTHASLSRFLF